MVDTALIDEEQVPVLNAVRKYLKNSGDIIPCGVFNGLEAVHLKNSHPIYQEGNISPKELRSKLLYMIKLILRNISKKKLNTRSMFP